MHNIKQDFSSVFETLELPLNWAKSILRSKDDVELFISEYYGNNRFVVDDLFDFKIDQVRIKNISLSSFVDAFNTYGCRESFEMLFMQEFSNRDIEMIEHSLIKGIISLEYLYERFKKNPQENILRHVMIKLTRSNMQF